MIRFLLIVIFLVVFLVLSIPVFLVEWLIGKWKPRLRDLSSLRIVQWAFRVIAWISGTKVTVIGEDRIPDCAVLFIGNHRSYYDIVLTYARCRRLTGYVSKKELQKVPLLSRWMKFLHCLFLDRSDIKKGLKVILAAIEHVKNGISIMIFPEGTRSTGESETDMLPFHEGSFKIAQKTGCPIVPVSITNSSSIFEDHLPFVRPAHVVIEYGEPIDLKKLSKEDQKFIGRYVQEIIRDTLSRNASRVRRG